MDKMLKQRLIGATILIALAVIFVPMLFEEPDPMDSAQEFTMDIPSPPSDRGEIRRLPLDPTSVVGSRLGDPEEPESDLPQPPAPEPMVEAVPDESLVDASTPAATTAPEPESPPDVVEPATDILADMPRDDAPESSQETIAAPAAPAASPPVEDPSSSAGDWIVQVASFSSSDTAERIENQLEQLGHSAGSDVLVRGDTRLHRVWTGPYTERAAAERARSQIAATVGDVDPLIKNVAGSDDAIPAGGSAGPVFSVQVGSFAEQANAERQNGQLLEQGFEAFIHADTSGSRPIWRVRVGRFAGRDQAAALLERLRSEKGLEGLIVSHP
jgi:DedD protein